MTTGSPPICHPGMSWRSDRKASTSHSRASSCSTRSRGPGRGMLGSSKRWIAPATAPAWNSTVTWCPTRRAASSPRGASTADSADGTNSRVEPWTLREVLSLDPADPPDEVLRRDPAAFDRYLLRGGFPGAALSREPSEVVLERLAADIVDVAIYKDLARERINTELADAPSSISLRNRGASKTSAIAQPTSASTSDLSRAGWS